jgi:hypothetical protein
VSVDTKFKPGHSSRGGRRKGSRDRIATALLEALAEDLEKFGAQTVKIARLERPVEYLRVIASVLPKELEITTNSSLRELSDDELDEYISRLRAERSTARGADDGTPKTIN